MERNMERNFWNKNQLPGILLNDIATLKNKHTDKGLVTVSGNKSTHLGLLPWVFSLRLALEQMVTHIIFPV